MQLCSNGSNCRITFAGHELLLDAGGALYWPAERLLIISDLHFEKSGFLTRFGFPLPRYDTRDTLKKIETLLLKYTPLSVVCLGDSFHDIGAYERFAEEDKAYLARLVSSVQHWKWVVGNHDAQAPTLPIGETIRHLQLYNVLLTHEPEESDSAQIIGHFHPKLRMRVSGHYVKGSCFVVSERMLIMPSLGSFTGGLDAGDKAITSIMPSARHYLLYRSKIWKI